MFFTSKVILFISSNRCCHVACKGLCQHIYTCNCQDRNKLCKHIHKVHSLNVRVYEEINFDELVIEPKLFHQQDQIEVKTFFSANVRFHRTCLEDRETLFTFYINKCFKIKLMSFIFR